MMYYSAAWYVYCRDQFKSINECGTNPNESPRPCRGGARPWAVALGPKLEVTSQLTHSVERIRWRKHFKVLVDSLVHAVSKSTKHSPESLSISSLGCHRRRSRILPPFRYFYEKILPKNGSTPKYSNGRSHVFNSYVTNRM